MAKIVLVTGGSRSGKSRYAQSLAESLPGRRVYVATALATDDEMRVRINNHRRERENRNWQALEVPTQLALTLSSEDYNYDVWLIDCLTLWINNLLFDEAQSGGRVDELHIAAAVNEVLEAARRRSGTIIFVTNEVGMAVVPENELARQYRDLVGRCNQVVATNADSVALVVCGIPLYIKEGG